MSWMPEDLNRSQPEAKPAEAKPAVAKEAAAASAPAAAPDPTSRESLKAGSQRAEIDGFVRDAVSFMRSAGQLPPSWGDAQIEAYADAEISRDQAAGQIVANREKDKAAYDELLRRWAHEQGQIVRNVQTGLPVGFRAAPPDEVARIAQLSDRAFEEHLRAEIHRAEAAANKDRLARGEPVRWST